MMGSGRGVGGSDYVYPLKVSAWLLTPADLVHNEIRSVETTWLTIFLSNNVLESKTPNI